MPILKSRCLKQVPPAIAKSFETIIPGAAALLVMNIIRFIFVYTPWGNAVGFIYKCLQTPLQGIGEIFTSNYCCCCFNSNVSVVWYSWGY